MNNSIKCFNTFLTSLLLTSCFHGLVSKKSSENYLLTNNSAGNIHIGMNYSKLFELYSSNEISISEGPNNRITKISKDDETLVEVYDKHNYPPKRISGIDVYSSKFKTSEGIYVGMPLKQFKLIYPKMTIFQSENPDNGEIEIFYPESYQTIEFNIVFSIGLMSVDGKLLGINYIDNLEKPGERKISHSFRSNGVINSISIYEFD